MNRITCTIAVLFMLVVHIPVEAAAANVGLNDVIATVEQSFRQGTTGKAPVTDFAANFFQRTLLADGQREMRGDGQMTVQLPAGNTPLMFRFEYFRPNQQEIVCNGRVLWIYHPDNREVILSDVSFLYNRSSLNFDRDRAVNFLHGLSSISRDFQINFAAGMFDPAGNYVLELTPRRAMLNTRRILLVVNRESVLSFVAGTGGKERSMPGTLPSPRTQGPQPQPRSPFGTTPPFGALRSDPFPILSTTTYDLEGNSTTLELTNIQVNGHPSETSFNFIVPGNVQIVRPSEQNVPR